MKRDWLWDRKISLSSAKAILNNPEDKLFISLSALLLSRKNSPQEVFKGHLKPKDFCQNWQRIKKKMSQDDWNNPRIEFWQAVYEKLIEKFRKRGISFEKPKVIVADEFCKMVGDKIRAIRKEKGLNQGDLARKLNVSQQMISHIESGKENISLRTLKNIVDSLGLKAEIEIK